MKRMTLIAVTLCLIMLTTVGAGVVAAKQTENPRHAGASSIYFYNVPAADTYGPGTLKIDVKHHTFVFNGKGFTPDMTYTLVDRTTGSGIHVLGTAKSTAAGNLHLAGTWEKGAALPGASDIGVTPVPLAVTLHTMSKRVFDGDTISVVTTFSAEVTSGNAVLYGLVRDDVGELLYAGDDPNLGGAFLKYPQGSTPPTVTLTAYDGAGNPATDYWPKT